ncbi:MAG: hypothetical protein AB1593_09720 [Pseudomonadota bacterium]
MKNSIFRWRILINFAVIVLATFSFFASVKADASQEKHTIKRDSQVKTNQYDFCGTQEWQRRTMVCRRGQNGKGYTVCEKYLKYLNQSLPKLAACGIPIPPKFKKPDWEELDVKSNLQLAYEANGADFIDSSLVQKPDFETWKKEILEEIAAGKIVPRMRKARITPTSKGEVTILGYTRDSEGCEKANRSVSDNDDQMKYELVANTSGYVYYILTEQGSLLSIEGNYGGVSTGLYELLLYAGKPYFVRGGGRLPPREIYAVDQSASIYDPDPENLRADLLCQFETVQSPLSKGR